MYLPRFRWWRFRFIHLGLRLKCLPRFQRWWYLPRFPWRRYMDDLGWTLDCLTAAFWLLVIGTSVVNRIFWLSGRVSFINWDFSTSSGDIKGVSVKDCCFTTESDCNSLVLSLSVIAADVSLRVFSFAVVLAGGGEVLAGVAEILAGVAEILAGVAEIIAGVAEVLAGVGEILARVGEVLAGFGELTSDSFLFSSLSVSSPS